MRQRRPSGDKRALHVFPGAVAAASSDCLEDVHSPSYPLALVMRAASWLQRTQQEAQADSTSCLLPAQVSRLLQSPAALMCDRRSAQYQARKTAPPCSFHTNLLFLENATLAPLRSPSSWRPKRVPRSLIPRMRIITPWHVNCVECARVPQTRKTTGLLHNRLTISRHSRLDTCTHCSMFDTHNESNHCCLHSGCWLLLPPEIESQN